MFIHLVKLSTYCGMVSTSMSADFHKSFQAIKADILSSLDAQDPSISDISRRLSTLRVELNTALPALPAYDQRSYDLQVKELESKLTSVRAKEKPKSRFAFASLPSPTGAPSVSPLPTITPPHILASHADDRPTPQPSMSHTISSRSHAHLRAPSLPLVYSTSTFTLTLSDLDSCVIDFRPSPSSSKSLSSEPVPVLTALHARSLSRCVLIAPVMSGSAMFSAVSDCLILVGAQQTWFRIHESRDSSALLHVTSLPVIEHCTGLSFGGYPPSLMDAEVNGQSRHREVQDFDWVRGGASPNWRLLGDEEIPFGDEERDLLDGEDLDVDGVLARLLPPAR